MPEGEPPIAAIRAAIPAASRFLYRRPALTFVVMGASFFAFGVTSVDLFVLIMGNVQLFIDYGWMVIDDGALRQLLELVTLAVLSGFFYVTFSVCDRTLLRRLTESPLAGLRG